MAKIAASIIDPVTVLRTGSYSCGLKALWVDAIGQIILVRLNAASQARSQAALQAQQTANAALAAVGVQQAGSY